MAMERILGTETGKSAFEKTDRNVVDLDTRLVADVAALATHKAEITQQTIVVTRDLSLVGVQTITTLPNRKIKSIRITGAVDSTNKNCDGIWSESGVSRCRYYYPELLAYSVSGYPIAFSNNKATDRTLGTIQNVVLGSFEINWVKIGLGATENAELVFLISYHD